MDNYHTLSNYKGAEGLYCPTAWELKSKMIKFLYSRNFRKFSQILIKNKMKQNFLIFNEIHHFYIIQVLDWDLK